MFESEFGVRMVRAQEQVRAVMPDSTQAHDLGLQNPLPLLSVERVAYTYNDAPMEVRRGLYRTDRHHYFNTLN
jgi:GntR family transcriptional regulator